MKSGDKLYPAKILDRFPSHLFQNSEEYLPMLEQLKTIRLGVIGEKSGACMAPYFISQPESPHIESLNITTLTCDQILVHFLSFLGSFMTDQEMELMEETIYVICSIRFMLNARGYQRRSEKIGKIIGNLRGAEQARGSSTKSTNATKTLSAGTVEIDVQYEIEMMQREDFKTQLEYCGNPRCSIEIFIDLLQHFLKEVYPAYLSRIVK